MIYILQNLQYSIKKNLACTSKAKDIIFSLCCFLFTSSVHCQKQDYIWLSGYNSAARTDTGWNSRFGVNKLDFNFSPIQIIQDSLGMGFTHTNVSYCDSNGDILFYSNGIYVANRLDEHIENSDGLNDGYYTSQYIDASAGNFVDNGILALDAPGSPNTYYLIHSFIDTINTNFNLFCKRTYYSYLSLNENAGRGKILEKNQTILSGLLGYDIEATRHANGRDWWILVQRRNTNDYQRILLTPTGLLDISVSSAGNIVSGLVGASCFSPDGSKYVYVNLTGGINLFDFDRCTGELSNPRYKPLPIFLDSNLIGVGAAFSPNSRFLYVSAQIHVYQFDLWATDIWSSIDTVARFDGAAHPFGSYFSNMQIAPDGKIYVSCGNGEYVYSVIERPDGLGDSCLFNQYGLTLPAYTGGGVPNFPNYRLGPLVGSPCDTITAVDEISPEYKESIIRAYPNPATDYVIIDYGFIDWNKGNVILEIKNCIGQFLFVQSVPAYSGLHKLDVSHFPPGFYTANIMRNTQVVAHTNFIKE